MEVKINIASGKGGTGKTLMSSVLAEMLGNHGVRTLVVDLDVFVRGLTALLYFHKQEALRLIDKEEISVADIFTQYDSSDLDRKELGISRYRSFDVLPSVTRIDEILNYNDIAPDTKEVAENMLLYLLGKISGKYNVIILDSRSGYDELVAATHKISSVTIVVEEDDDISKVTSDNLVRQLQNDSDTPLFRIINKARGINTKEDLEKEIKGISNLGVIPFDIDVMNSFGAATFWEDISRSLYKFSLAQTWNRLNQKMQIGYEIGLERFSPLPSEKLEKRISFLATRDRILFSYGLLLGAIGFLLALFGGNGLEYLVKSPIEYMSIILGFAGMSIALGVILKGNKK